MNYVVERREVLAQDTRVHYYAGVSGGVARWEPDAKDGQTFGYKEARSFAAHCNRASKRVRLYHVFYKATNAEEAR